MKLIKLSISLLSLTTLFAAFSPAQAGHSHKSNMPDLSNVEDVLSVCKTINVGTEEHTFSQSSQNALSNTSIDQSASTSIKQSDSKGQIGHDCDGIADSISKVETNRANNDTLRYIANKKAESELIKNLTSW